MSLYPDAPSARDRFIIGHRPPRAQHDPWLAHGVVVDDEPTADGATTRVATVFLTGRECPWRCLMCDLWQYTTEEDTPVGAIPAQMAAARRTIDAQVGVTHVKLYNAGSFFDPRAVPELDYDAIATATVGFERVIVESHPALVGARTERWLDAMRRATASPPALEVAMGLETVHPHALDRLNKRMTPETFVRAADWLARLGVALRVFVLVSPPFIQADEQDHWLLRSVDFAWACGASVVSLIPTRTGNGALDRVADEGYFHSPTLADLERSFDLALARPRPAGARVFADVWDLDRFATCASCLPSRRARLQSMNLRQRSEASVSCRHAGAEAPTLHDACDAAHRDDGGQGL